VNILTADQVDIAERFTGKDGLKGAERFAGAEWTTLASGVPAGGLAGSGRFEVEILSNAIPTPS
jgi:flavin reductase (DIM6/NTAB) family NADH-FMN oxidoreductase RutF